MIPLRLTRELTYQLDQAGEHERLARALASIPVFLAIWNDDRSSALTMWELLANEGREPEKYYPAALEAFRTSMRASCSLLLPDVIQTMSALFELRRVFDVSIELRTELRAWAAEHSDDRRLMCAENGLGTIDWRRGHNEQAMTHLAESLRLAESLGDKRGMSAAIGNIGNVYWKQGRYADAMSCYERHLALAESFGDKGGMSIANGNMGNVHLHEGRYADAISCYKRQLALAESFGDKGGMSIANGNMGSVHLNQGRKAEAISYFERNLTIAESLGDKLGMAFAIGSIGNVHADQGRFADAMSCYERFLALAESLGDKGGMALAIGNMGTVLADQGRYAEAMLCYERQLTMTKSLGDKHGMARTIGNIGEVHLKLGRHEEALLMFQSALEESREIEYRVGTAAWLEWIARTRLELAKGPEGVDEGGDQVRASRREARENAVESLRIREELQNPDTIFSGSVLLACIDAAEGHVTLAIEKLEAMLAEATDEERIADLHYWLWNIEGSAVGTHHAEALTRYTSLYSRIQKFEFRKRIAELKGERIPMSADDLK